MQLGLPEVTTVVVVILTVGVVMMAVGAGMMTFLWSMMWTAGHWPAVAHNPPHRCKSKRRRKKKIFIYIFTKLQLHVNTGNSETG